MYVIVITGLRDKKLDPFDSENLDRHSDWDWSLQWHCGNTTPPTKGHAGQLHECVRVEADLLSRKY